MTSEDQPGRGPVAMTELPLEARFSLRCRPDGRSAIAAGLGVSLPDRISAVATKGSRRALCLGPDEWQIDTTAADARVVLGAMAAQKTAHSLVDITDREVTWRLSGEKATELLSAGIARDLSRIAPHCGSRTVFDGVQAILFRESETDWTLSVWRSFAPHARHLIDTVNEELVSGL